MARKDRDEAREETRESPAVEVADTREGAPVEVSTPMSGAASEEVRFGSGVEATGGDAAATAVDEAGGGEEEQAAASATEPGDAPVEAPGATDTAATATTGEPEPTYAPVDSGDGRPELQVLAAFAGAFVLAKLLRRLRKVD
ncbi:MAG TPA: hypothetical protein VF520_02090 [Thermoleophilaceae bacterium]|jgi:hypothetical protein